MFDPMSLEIHSVADEAALDEQRLSAAFLRQQFQHAPVWQPEKTDESLLHTNPVFKPAAVLLALVERESGLHVLLTERAAHLHHHPGQISFPGGRVDATDTSAEHTALREAEEEIGLPAARIELLGRLPLYYTGTGFAVTPVVALVQPPFELHSDPFEVASIFEVPLHFLMNPRHHQRRQLQLSQGSATRTFYAMPYERYFIWGATAGMLRNLFHFLRAGEI